METQVKQWGEGSNFRTNGKKACWKGEKAEEEREGTHLAKGQKFVYCFRSYEFSSNGRWAVHIWALPEKCLLGLREPSRVRGRANFFVCRTYSFEGLDSMRKAKPSSRSFHWVWTIELHTRLSLSGCRKVFKTSSIEELQLLFDGRKDLIRLLSAEYEVLFETAPKKEGQESKRKRKKHGHHSRSIDRSSRPPLLAALTWSALFSLFISVFDLVLTRSPEHFHWTLQHENTEIEGRLRLKLFQKTKKKIPIVIESM